MTRWLFMVVCLGIVCQGTTSSILRGESLNKSLSVLHEWKFFDYDFDSDERRQDAILSGEYDYRKNYPSDVDQWHGKIFVTMLRYNGVPSSLNVISKKIGDGGPLLQPYPDWSFAKYDDCSGIVSATKLAIDKCDRLWVLDSGLVNNTQPMCSPKLLTFDLTTSQLLKQVEIPHDVAVNATTGKGRLSSLAVQPLDCNINGDTMVYIADEKGEGLIVYHDSDYSFHRLTSKTFDYDPKFTKMTINGESFTTQNGISGMALSPMTNNLYYSPVASTSLYYVNTEQFRTSNYEQNAVHYEGVQNILDTQSSAKVVSKSGVLFFGLVGDSALGCWNEHRSLERHNIRTVAQSDETLQMIVGMKIKEALPHVPIFDRYINREYILVLSNRMQKMANNDYNFNDVNFRIMDANVNDLILNTRCENPNNDNTPFKISIHL
uniref:Major royal jelly protein MRJP1 n=1 Tax=Apis cerana cerana TaxID=94128 RepID=Q5VLE2_APICC|nr:major royal jelly protein MRJP1 [Apis cerana cerana]